MHLLRRLLLGASDDARTEQEAGARAAAAEPSG
jgi:hypothetical protein